MSKVTGVVSAESTVAGRATTTSVVAGTASSSGVVIGGNATGVSKLTAVVTMGKKKLSGNVQTSGSGGGTLNHSLLLNRDLPNQHPIQAIAGLQALLDSLTSDISKKADDVEITDGYMYLLSNGERIAGPFGPFGTGSGGLPSFGKEDEGKLIFVRNGTAQSVELGTGLEIAEIDGRPTLRLTVTPDTGEPEAVSVQIVDGELVIAYSGGEMTVEIQEGELTVAAPADILAAEIIDGELYVKEA